MGIMCFNNLAINFILPTDNLKVEPSSLLKTSVVFNVKKLI